MTDEKSQAYDPNMNIAWNLGRGMTPNWDHLPTALEDVGIRARLAHAIDGSIVTNFAVGWEDAGRLIGEHIFRLAGVTPQYFPSSLDRVAQVGLTLRLWAGLMSAAKTIAYKTRNGINRDEVRLLTMQLIERNAHTDLIYRAGVEAAVSFKRLRRQRVYLDCFNDMHMVRRYAPAKRAE